MMTRKEWLEKFIELCDTGAKTLDFRRHCRVKAQHLPRHIRRLDAYRAELDKLRAVDRQEEIRQARLRALEEARRVKAEQAAIRARELESRLQEQREHSAGYLPGSTGPEDSEGDATSSDEETVGPREGDSED